MLHHIWNKVVQALRFKIFEHRIHSQTWEHHDNILRSALDEATAKNKSSLDICVNPVVAKGFGLRRALLAEFHNKLKSETTFRIAIHVPPKHVSPGGYSLFTNLAESLAFIGIETRVLLWGDDLNKHLQDFYPTVFLTSDHHSYLSRIDWEAICHYRRKISLRVGLTASLEEYGNSSLSKRLQWAERHRVDFYYSFRQPNYFRRKEYEPFFENGYKILSVEFGANPFIYYPASRPIKDVNYVFLASSNPDKQKRYEAWLGPIVRKYAGFIDGPGWGRIQQTAGKDIHRFLYARAKVGINLHIDNSINWSSELNERTYILAACGTPQLVDNPKLLPLRFSSEAMFVASSPKEYVKLFEYILDNPQEAGAKALCALDEVYRRHTTLHRAEAFINQLISIL